MKVEILASSTGKYKIVLGPYRALLIKSRDELIQLSSDINHQISNIIQDEESALMKKYNMNYDRRTV